MSSIGKILYGECGPKSFSKTRIERDEANLKSIEELPMLQQKLKEKGPLQIFRLRVHG